MCLLYMTVYADVQCVVVEERFQLQLYPKCLSWQRFGRNPSLLPLNLVLRFHGSIQCGIIGQGLSDMLFRSC